MKLVTDYREFIRELGQFRKKYESTFTNFFKLSDEISKLVRQGRLYFDATDDCFLIFQSEDNFYQFYYCLGKGGGLPHLDVDKTLVTWLIKNSHMNTDDVEDNKAVLEQAGFTYKVRNLQFQMKLAESEDWLRQQKHNFICNPAYKDFTLDFLRPDDIEDFLSLLRSAFLYYRIEGVPYELDEILRNHNAVVVRDVRTGKVVAAYVLELSGKKIHTKKLCVDKKYRGKGLGKIILIASLVEAIDRGGRRWLVEIDEDNITSLRLHGCLPIQNTGTVADLFVRNV